MALYPPTSKVILDTGPLYHFTENEVHYRQAVSCSRGIFKERRENRSSGNDNGSLLVGLFIRRMDDQKRAQAKRPVRS